MPGMQEFLKDFAKKEEPADADWRQNQAGKYQDKILSPENIIDLWRTLKTLTEGEANKNVKSVRARDGCLAWQKLSERF